MRKVKMSAGRSINLALSERGLHGLMGVGLEDEVMKMVIPMKGRMIHSLDGELTFQPYSKDGKQAIYSISRGDLNCKLMTLAEKRENVTIRFDMKCNEINFRTNEVHLENEVTKKEQILKAQTIFGADGFGSAVRQAMQKLPSHLLRMNYSQSYLANGYKELTIPAGEGNTHVIDKNCLHIWPRGKFMLIALPNLDGSFTATCFFPYEGENGFDRLDNGTDEEVKGFFAKNFPDALKVMPTLLEDWRSNPTSALCTVKCFPWSYQDKCVLFGDAGHAIVPFFGQGMNAGFEDCAIFDSLMDKHMQDGKVNWESLFQEYQTSRKPNTDAIADMAVENFEEMSAKTADPHFLFMKKVQHLLGNKFPGHFLSRYEMVSFSRLPYAEAVRLGKICDDICHELIRDAGEENIDKINLEKAKELVYRHFPHPILESVSKL